MADIQSMASFYRLFMEEVLIAEDRETSGWTTEDFLTSVMLEYLEDAGEGTTPVICPFRGRGLQLNAYAFSEDCENIDIFVSIYSAGDEPRSVPQSEIDVAIKRALELYHRAINDLYTAFQKDNDTYEFAISIFQNRQNIKTVRICALTNGLVKPIPFKNLTLGGVEISFHVWDIDRLHRCVSSGRMRETIEIDFEEKFKMLIPCIENSSSDKYSVYLAILNGEILASLYDEFRDRLLEKNVRSFLQVKGNVNKGIRDTLRVEPDMFLAYNNGISVTAESVKIVRDENGKPSIKSIRDMQIVNGGQTTASIYAAFQNKVDLSNVNVQMKLTVIKSDEQMDTVISNISRYANSQNKITMSDFSANDDFHIKLEQLSRRVYIPVEKGKPSQRWFYERARGQYSVEVNRQLTAASKRKYKEQNPKNKCISKTVAAKCAMCWLKHPDIVSKGLETNFIRYSEMIQSGEIGEPDENFFCNLIAQVILFQQCDKIVDDQNFGGYKAQINYYTIALLSEYYSDKVDLSYIWQHQDISSEVSQLIEDICYKVWNHFMNPNINNAKGVNITQWCKKEDCWIMLKKRFQNDSI